MRLHGEVVRGGALVLGLRRLHVARAGAPVPQRGRGAGQQQRALLGRGRRQLERLHAAERELLQLVEAELAAGGARVPVRQLAARGARYAARLLL